MNTILIIDDEEKLRSLLQRIISLEGFDVQEARNFSEAFRKIKNTAPDVVLCDVKLPDGNGVEKIREIKAQLPLSEVILLTAYGNIEDGVQAMRNGAFDYIVKGDENDKLIPLLHKAMEKVGLRHKVMELQQRVSSHYSFDSIIGHSPAILEAVRLAKKVAETDTPVLLLGETGTGKEIFAESIHYSGPRRMHSFVAVNCSAFSKDLLESELFGHKAGAFTGAIRDRKGLFEEADGGTIFLDEIGEMAVELQSKLLRVLESGEFMRVGETKSKKADVRIIAATNRDLAAEAADGRFRSDLFYRLAVFRIELPPLRSRVRDIPALAAHFAAVFSLKTNKTTPHLGTDYLEGLQAYPWPGNIRELRNIVERSVILNDSGELTAKDLPAELRQSPLVGGADLASVERNHIARILVQAQGNKTEAAKILGIGLTTLYRKIEEYKL